MEKQIPKFTRRQFLGFAFTVVPGVLIGNSFLFEPTWLKTTTITLNPQPTHRLVHFTDFHFKGDDSYAEKVIESINQLQPDFACFTGDLIESKIYLEDALGYIKKIKCPVYGVPGNHDHKSGADFKYYYQAFGETGGGWLINESVLLSPALEIVGIAERMIDRIKKPLAEKRILLTHYPKTVDEVKSHTFSLVLAGHSHGGQVRIPFLGAPVLPNGVGRYDLGFFETGIGPLYVNPGIGTLFFPWRFNCRPEITVIEI